MKEPIHHLIRPDLPWRSEFVTECKLPAANHPAWTREQAKAEHDRLGQQRFSLFVCMNCWNTASRHPTWGQSPSACIRRHVEHAFWRRPDEDEKRMDAELRAIAALIEAHRDEFDGFLEGLAQSTDLTAKRVAKRAAQRYGG